MAHTVTIMYPKESPVSSKLFALVVIQDVTDSFSLLKNEVRR